MRHDWKSAVTGLKPMSGWRREWRGHLGAGTDIWQCILPLCVRCVSARVPRGHDVCWGWLGRVGVWRTELDVVL